MGLLRARLVGIDLATGRQRGSIPLPLQASADMPRHDVAVCNVSYPEDAPRPELISADGAVWALQLAEDEGEWTDPPNALFYTADTTTDRYGKTRVWTVVGRHVGWRILMGEIVGREGTINEDGYRVFSSSTPGKVLRELITTAQARPAKSGLPWAASLVINFTADRDSAGNPWPNRVSPVLPTQRHIGQVLQDLAEAGALEYEWRGMELYITGPDGLTRDRSQGRNPTILRHYHSTETPEKRTLVDTCTDVDFAGDEGYHETFGEPDSFAPLGRLVTPISQGQTTTYATAKRRADLVLQAGRLPATQYSRAGTNSTGGPLPILDVRNGDRVVIDTATGPTVDVVGINVTFGAKETRWHWTLGTMLESNLTRIRRKADLALAGAGVVGGDGTAPRPPGPDLRIPEKVLGLIAAADTYIDPEGLAAGRVLLAWTAVQHATDGTVLERLKAYEIHGRTSGEPATRFLTSVDGDTTTVELSGLTPGALWEYQVRAVSEGSQLGAFSDLVTVEIDPDLDPPYRPTPPLLSSIAGTNKIRWDGKGVGTAATTPLDMPPDLRSVRVRRYGTNPTSTPTILGPIAGTGEADFILDPDVVSGETYYYDLIAVDRSGNESTASEQASVVGRSVADDPEIVNQLGAELVADDAWIGDLTAVIVTADFFKGRRFELSDGGMFASGPADTPRWELSSTGLVERDTANRKLASWEPGFGIRLYNTAGQVMTQLSTQDYGLSVRNPNNGVLTPASSIIFGGAMNQSGAPADWLEYGLYPNQLSSWMESPRSVDTFVWAHAGSRAKVDYGFEAYSSLGDGSKPAVNLVQMAFRIKNAATGAIVYDSSGNLKGTLAPPGIPYGNDQDQAYFQGVNFVTFNLAPGNYRFVPLFRIGTNTSGAGVGTTSIRERSVAIGQW